MKAVILAGGEGRRLRPLTERLPKPLLPLPDRPVIDYILYRLAKAGVTEAAITLGFLGKMIREKLGDSRHGISLTYYEEKVPRGTAGSVKNAEDFLDEDFLVLCGDGMFDFDLSACIAAHEKSGADVTLLLTRHPRPREYGVVLCDPRNRVIRFLEKPDWTQTFADTVNTGIYLCKRKILSHIPAGARYDFSMDLFPALLREGFLLQGYTTQGYWCDIGSPSSYYRCVQDALIGKINDVPLPESRRNLYKAGNGYYYQADGVIRGEDTVVTAGSVINEGCRLLRGSMVDSAVLFPEITLHEDCRVDRCILSKGVTVGREVRVPDGVVTGENCQFEDFSTIPPGTAYPADTTIRYSGQRAFSEKNDELFDTDGIPLTLSTEQAVKIGRAAALAADEDHIFIMHGISCEETLLANEVAAGVMLAGKTAKRLGEGEENLAAFAAVTFVAPLLIHVSTHGGEYKAILLDRYGLPVTNAYRRRIEQIFDAPFPDRPVGKSENIKGCRELYLHTLTAGGKPLTGETFFVSLGRSGDLLADALTSLSATVRRDQDEKNQEICFSVSENGKRLTLTKGNEQFDFAHLSAVILKAEAEKGARSFAIPYLAPRIFDTVLSPYGATLYRYLSVGGEFEQEARALASIQPYLRDGVFAAIKLLGHFTEKDGFHPENLFSALKDLPPFQTVEEEFAPANIDQYKASLLTRLSLAGGKGKEGIAFTTGNGYVALTPQRRGFRIIAQSFSTEAATELCADMKGKIQDILNGNDRK